MANKAMIGLGLQEDVSQGMQKIEDSIEDVSAKSKELAMISKRVDDISKKSLPARRELKQLQDLMANMNLKGLANTDEFTKAAVRAGELKDAIADTQQAVRAYSDDIMTLNFGAEVFQGVAAAGSIATSAMALFGKENEKVNQILLKVQAAQGLLNGVTTIANLLNKDSVIMLKLKQVQMAINSATTKKDTVLTTANTVAQTANTVATKADTVAQTAWNTAKAIGNALLGNFSSLVLVGIGAVATYAVATAGATDEQEKLNDEVDKGAEAQKGYKKVMADTYSSLMTSYEQLKNGWNNSIGLSISVPIFNNRQTKSAVEKAKLQYQTSQLTLLDEQKTLYKTIEGLWLDANSAQQRYAAAIEKLHSTQTSYELVSEQFNVGMKNTVELLTEKNNLLQAQQELLQSKYMAILNTQLLKFYQGDKITL